ncbi:translesion DNA synthesis-associated protein ImuA [Vibrio sonorensis]|uniref:translesion DNA synthesis-associated protein ImuA n=1 Tax=Vibrio sonorensis TaxID=1004316 RepID=UPI0008DB31EB|nr:translesion DNA synthesis-associated protein ImuA [Vibrio sonorensis]
MHELIENLKQKQWLWQANHTQSSGEYQSTGFDLLDQKLSGGFPLHGVVEIQSPMGIGELRLLMPHLRHNHTDRLTVFVQPPGHLCAEYLMAEGLNPDRVLLVNPKDEQQALWVAEQCLKSGACSNVLLWHQALEVHQVRRLQVAGEQGNCLQFLFKSQQAHLFSLPVSLSMTLLPHEQGLEITITKRRGGWPHGKFVLNMKPYWPKLAIAPQSSVVVPFPVAQQG